MLPSILAQEVSQGLKSFITTGFESSSPFFSDMFSRFVNTPGQMIKAPYLSLSLPFQPGNYGADFFQSLIRITLHICTSNKLGFVCHPIKARVQRLSLQARVPVKLSVLCTPYWITVHEIPVKALRRLSFIQ